MALAAPPSEQTQACVAASTQGQTDRDDGRLLAAREQLLLCTREVCPSIVRKSCSGWLAELGERIPSVVVRVHDAEQRDVTDARVVLDGRAIALDGRPVSLDPGTHALAVYAQGAPHLERTFLVAERERGRLLIVELPAPSKTPAPSVPAPVEVAPVSPTQAVPARASTPSSDQRSPRAPSRFTMPIAGWVLGGLGVAAVASFVGLRSKAQSDLHELQRRCAPDCLDRERDDGKRKALAADVSLGIGIGAFAGAGAWLFGSWLRQRDHVSADPRTAQFSLAPTRGGAFALLTARY